MTALEYESRVESGDTNLAAEPCRRVLEVRGLVVRYGPRPALRGVDLELARGEILGLLGVNGAGKTTLIRRLAGVLPSQEGTVELGGSDPALSKAARARLGYLPEEPPLYNDETVLRYVTYMAALAGLPRRDRLPAAEQALERADADDLAPRLTGRLSKGQRQRVGLAAAIVHSPDVVLLDEPTSGLDPVQRVSFRKLLRKLAKSSAILFSTHVLAEAQAVCDRVVILDQGSVVTSRPVGGSGEDRVRVRVRGAAPATVHEALCAVPGVRAGLNEIYELDGPAAGQGLVATILARGWTLLEFAPVRDDLEETFLSVIAGRST